ncbi:oxygenase MpaB family protein [Actinocorallia sp. A-T 12471]|uniref:oxygenase MpaB family protein n=1 Tax=Actinocorallia sp. A-T 12471 TaxID=3089813 RepID=UPI0029D003AB|nr:oxygenase MpaB family protein [Actinocorallia sp. A-T 12471]MDX6742749.1 oxygenase MpaB family protein [Actinocorallia sp. A-T 12471]
MTVHDRSGGAGTGLEEEPPTRFRADPEWARRSARALRSFVPDPDPTPEEFAAVARGLTRSDEAGAALAVAIGEREVTLAQFREALAHGVPHDAPEPLRAFFAVVEDRPGWVDEARLRRGARVMRRAGTNMVDVLNGSLLSGYRSSADTAALVMTGALSGAPTRRLGETMKWAVECVREDGMARWGEGWRLTVHVRLMHALVNRRLVRRADWDVRERGLPINQADQGATLGLHCTYYLLGIRMLGFPVGKADADAVMHLWRYVGWLMGVADEWLPLSEAHGRRIFYRLSLAAPPPDEHSRALAAAFEESRRHLTFKRFEGPRRAYELAKSRSLARVLVGGEGMRELGLRAAPPWYHLLRIPANLVKHGLLRHLPGGERWLTARGERELDRTLPRHFANTPATIGPHPTP